MMRIDAHQHFWKFDAVRDSWITDEMHMIRRDFYPSDLETILKQNKFDGSVVVQSTHDEGENAFHLDNAAQYDFIKGIVGWLDLQAPDLEEKLTYYGRFRKIKGFRHVLQGEAHRTLMLTSSFMNGIGRLARFGFTYDILILADQLKYVPEFVSSFPDQKFVIDHLAKPQIKDGGVKEWKTEMLKLAKYPNVFCKISGMVTEAHWKNWKAEDFTPFLDVVVETFGTGRIMYGSDWPVCLVAASYERMLHIVEEYFSSFPASAQQSFFGGNAALFYNL